MCRICHSGEQSSLIKGEPLISPCNCRGTSGLYHRSCLEKWLSTRRADASEPLSTRCEICHYEFDVEHKHRPFAHVRAGGVL